MDIGGTRPRMDEDRIMQDIIESEAGRSDNGHTALAALGCM